MARRFKQVDYEKSGQQTITSDEVLSADHLARFIVGVVTELDLSSIYAQYAARGGEVYAPEVLLGLWFYGYATGVCSARQIEQATYESIPFRYIAGGLHPDHDTLAHFRRTFLPQIAALFGPVLLVAPERGVLQLEHISVDGSKIHADASKSKAVSYQRLGQLEEQVPTEVAELLALSTPGTQEVCPEGLEVEAEVLRRQEHLEGLQQAKAVLEQRAAERYEQEKARYEVKMREREERAQRTGRKPRGRQPQPLSRGRGTRISITLPIPSRAS